MEEESFFETSEEADCLTSWTNLEKPLISAEEQVWDTKCLTVNVSYLA
jgi:hypothetical protein